ncbi:MAG: 2OG-Fe(II) oxygenase [Chromatiales bacterium]|nr:2OG-Fe(II) oxygenase [Chromatiales bacterium]
MNPALALSEGFDSHTGGSDVFDRIARAVERDGYVYLDGALPLQLTAALHCRATNLEPDRDLMPAGIGRDIDHHVNRFVRTDRIHWLGREQAGESAFFAWMDRLRLGLNRRLFLGLFDYECHFAHYGPGDYYKRHTDAFHGQTNRVLSTVLYLNPEWQSGDGGELLMYPHNGLEPLERIAPVYGRLVVFLSETFPHEVLACRRDRYSIAGWFRVNASIAGAIDPPR